jgi:hypothetical protein
MIYVQDIQAGAGQSDAVLFRGRQILGLDGGVVQRELIGGWLAAEADLHAIESKFGGQGDGFDLPG